MEVLRISIVFYILFAQILIKIKFCGTSPYCRETLENHRLKQIKWPYLKECLRTVSGENISRNMSENIWRLMKLSFDAIDNIPSHAYKYMGYSLVAIPMEELHNISMENVDVVEAFGSIYSTRVSSEDHQEGFSAEQLRLLAHKVRTEWLGKNPKTYSEYDLRAMGEILCYMNVSDIEQIHTEAFTEAAEWIGRIEHCPQDRLQALAKVARRPRAFGEPSTWSKLAVSIIGNVLNGLPSSDINLISKDKLQLNHFYKPGTRTTQGSSQKWSNKTLTSQNGTSGALGNKSQEHLNGNERG